MARVAPLRRPANHIAITALIGAVTGAFSGLFGIGGGILIVPCLVFFLRMDQRLAHGTSLAATLLPSGAGLAGYALEQHVDWLVAAPLTAGAMAGAWVGTWALQRWSNRTLRVAFAGLLIATAVRLLVDLPLPGGRSDVTLGLAVGLIACGIVAGCLAGLMGVGGGVVLVPALMLIFGMPAAIAKGTSLAMIVPTAILGSARNLRKSNISGKAALTVGIGGMITAFGAARASVRLDPVLSSLLFGILLLLIAGQLLLPNRK